MRKVALQLVTKIRQALEVLCRPAHTALGLTPSFLVFGNAGGFLDEYSQLFGLGLD